MTQAGRFQDKVVIVTGAARGIGSAIAARIAAEGASLVLVDLERPTASRPTGLVDGPAVWTAAPTDVGREEEVAAVFDGALQRFGHIDHVVNNAAVMTFKPGAALAVDGGRLARL